MKHELCCPNCEHIFFLSEIKKRRCVACGLWCLVGDFSSSGRTKCKICLSFKQERFYNDSRLRKKVGAEYLKWCGKCRSWLLEKNFYAHTTSGDGLGTICKKCAEIGTKKSRQKAQPVTPE